MPFVNVKLIEGVFSAAQKKDLIKRLTDAVAAVEGENIRQLIWVVIDEVKSGEWGIGGRPITAKDVKAMAARKVKKE